MRASTAKKIADAGLLFDALTVDRPPLNIGPEGRRAPLAKPDADHPKSLASPAHQLPAIIRYRSQTENALKRSVPRRIPQMLRQYWGFDPMPYQIRDLEELFGYGHHLDNDRLRIDKDPSPVPGRKCKLRPTEFGKSTGFLYAFPILSLAEDPNACHGIICTNDLEAQSWMYNIQTFLEGNAEFIRDYPWCKKPTRASGKKWGAREIWVDGRDDSGNRNASVLASGYRSGMLKGRRFKGVFDDLEGLGSASEAERDRLWRKATQELWRTMEGSDQHRRPLQLFVGTPFDVDSFYFKLEELADIVTDRLPWKYPEDWPETFRRGQIIWPEKRDKVLEFRRTRDPLIFSVAMELDPTGGNPDVWGTKDIIRMAHRLKSEPMVNAKTFACLDPASGSKLRGADYAGISVTRVRWDEGDELPTVEVNYAEGFRGGLYEQCDRLAYLCKWYHCPALIEGNGPQKYTYDQVMRDRHPEIKLVYFYSTQEKIMDTKLGTSVIKTLIRFDRLHTVEPLGQDTDPGMMKFRAEIRDLGVSKNDHICKSVWFAIRHMYEGGKTRSPAGRVRSSGPRPQFYGQPGGFGNSVVNTRAVRRRMGIG